MKRVTKKIKHILNKYKKTIVTVLTVFIFIWGLSLRGVELINRNFLFGFDMGRDYLAAYDIVVNHKLTLIGPEIGAGSAGISNIFHGPGYFYLIALCYMLFRGDPYGALIMMFLFGIGTLLLSYLTTKKIFSHTTAILVLFLVGVSPLIVPQSRFMWNSHPTSFFIVLVLYFAYCIPKKPRLYVPLSLFIAGSIYHFELAIAVPLVLTLVVSLPLIYKIKDVRTYLYSFCAVLIAFLPFFMFEMRHGWNAMSSLWFYIIGGGSSSQSIPMAHVMDHTQSYMNNAINSFIIDKGFLPLWAFKSLSIGLFIVLFIFSFTTKDMQKRKFFSFLFLMLIVSYIVFMFLNNSVWDYYLIHAHFVFMYVFAYLGASIISKFRKSLVHKGLFIIFAIFLASMFQSSYRRIVEIYQNDIHDLGGVEKINGKKIAIDYIYQDAKGKPFSEFTFMAPIYTYPYDYLFKTYAKQTYGYSPGNEKKGLVYLVIEPDGSMWYKGWLETVIVGGDILETKTLPTGHIIQKRMFPL